MTFELNPKYISKERIFIEDEEEGLKVSAEGEKLTIEKQYFGFPEDGPSISFEIDLKTFAIKPKFD